MSWVVVLALAASPPDAGAAPPPPFEWNVPSVIEAVPVGQTLQVNGLPMRLFAVRSKLGLKDLLTHYTNRFAALGYFLPPRLGKLEGLTLPRVEAYDPVAQLSYLVYGWPEADKTTTLMLGSADLGARRRSALAGEALPTFPGATGVTRFDLEATRGVSFEAKASEAEVIDFYRATLPSGGWAEREPGVFVRQGRAVQVLAKPDKSRGVLGVVLLDQADHPPDLSLRPTGTAGGPGTR